MERGQISDIIPPKKSNIRYHTPKKNQISRYRHSTPPPPPLFNYLYNDMYIYKYNCYLFQLDLS